MKRKNYYPRSAPQKGADFTRYIMPAGIIMLIIILFKPLKDVFSSMGSLGTDAIQGVKSLTTKVAESVGIKTSNETKQIVKQVETSESYWSPNFWKKGGAGTVLLTVAQAEKYITDITSCFGYFSDDFIGVFGVFKRLKTQSQVSWIADRYNIKYKGDFLTMLRGNDWSFGYDNLSDSQIAQIDNYIKTLPKYKV